jgi:gephyrin
MKSVEEALDLIKQFSLQSVTEKRKVDEDIIGYVLAEDVTAPEAVPAFRASIVDGYAIRIPNASKFEKGVYPVSLISVAKAGEIQELKEGQLARITTGAPLPPGSSAVVMVEDTILKTASEDGKEEKEVEILTSKVKEGENVREIGSDISQGSVILRKGNTISAIGGELGMLASVGITEVLVYRKPVIGVLSTGDELVKLGSVLPGDLRLGQVRDTNRPTLITVIKATGFEAIDLGIVSDT